MLEVAVFEMWGKKIFISYLTRLATGLESAKMSAKCILHVLRLCWQCSGHSNSTSKDLSIFFQAHEKKNSLGTYEGLYQTK